MDRGRLGRVRLGVATGASVTLSSLADAHGRFAILAADHRDSLRAFLRPDAPDSLSAQEITNLKIELVRAVSPAATGVMLEPEFSIPQVVDAGALAPGVGFTAALEAQGYLSTVGESPTTVLDGWSPKQALESGAACAKLLLPYHPDRPLAAKQEAVAASVVADCRTVGIPIVLEPLFYDLERPADRPRVVIETATRFSALNPDLLKLPFPTDPVADPDEEHWAAVCLTISALVPMPWAVLSGGGSFDSFERQVAVAMDNGCSGFMVGRALWGDAMRLGPGEREASFESTVLGRMWRLRSLLER